MRFFRETYGKYIVVLMAFILVLLGCAVVKPPSGGPEDKVPPKLLSIIPPSDSVGVSKNVVIRMSFSEAVDVSSFKKKINVYPPVQIKKMRAKGGDLFIEFSEELPETTFCIILKPGFRDYHGVESKAKHIFYFSTSDSMERGSVSGRVFFKRNPDSSAVVTLFEVRGDSTIDFLKDEESRMVFTGFDGSFVFKALPTDSVRFLLFAFTDKNGNGRYDSGKEFSSSFKDTIILTYNSPDYTGADIYIIDPNEPAELKGRVINQTGFDVYPLVILMPVLPGEKAMYKYVQKSGEFAFEKVKPGSYILEALIDVEGDSVCGTFRNPSDTTVVEKEPCVVLPDTIRLSPGEKVELKGIILKKEID